MSDFQPGTAASNFVVVAGLEALAVTDGFCDGSCDDFVDDFVDEQAITTNIILNNVRMVSPLRILLFFNTPLICVFMRTSLL
jgi:hypothetical protein